MLPVHPALVDDQCHEVLCANHHPQLPNHAVVEYEIAARVGFSQMHVSRLQPRALARMRTQLIEP